MTSSVYSSRLPTKAGATPGDGPGVGIRLVDVHKQLGGRRVLAGLNLRVDRGEFVSLLAPSGAGKSTVLNVIAGFLPVDSGRVELGGRDVTALAPSERNVGFIFQDFALFPHMSVEQNVAFPLRARHVPKAEIAQRVAAALRMVGLESLGKRRPAALSGGQRQRVAIARALVYRPPVLLMDEPLSSLDRALREDMTHEIKNLQQELGVTVLYVTHDQQEALTLSDRIGVLHDGVIVQYDRPETVYHQPRSAYVARLVGALNEAEAIDVTETGDGQVQGRLGTTVIRGVLASGQTAKTIRRVGVRPQLLTLRPERPADGGNDNALPVVVVSIDLTGSGVRYALRTEWGAVWYALLPDTDPRIVLNAEAYACWPPGATLLMEA